MSVFYESYCPDCIQFVEEQLMSVYKLFVDHFQLYLLPYGNAHVGQSTDDVTETKPMQQNNNGLLNNSCLMVLL